VRYALELVRSTLRTPRKLAQGLLLRDLTSWIRIEFLGTAVSLGMIEQLSMPRTTNEIASALGFSDPALLESFLALGESLGELRRDEDRWCLRGRRARALANPALAGMNGLVDEAVTYDADVYLALRRRLRGEPPGDYLTTASATVARASRTAEVVLTPFVRALVRRRKPKRLLDVGCGSGVYLRAVAEASRTVTGIGIDVSGVVVEAARRNLAGWGIDDRFGIRDADLRAMPADLAGPWDLVLLFQNIYYFPPAERPAVLAMLRGLAPDGAVAVATVIAGAGDPIAGHLDVVLRSTAGNYPLPSAREVSAALHEAGFAGVAEHRLALRQPVRAFVAS
jgi:4-hydroxy-2,2'-bipyrrole-5-carbaldehyde O-methyltransferase